MSKDKPRWLHEIPFGKPIDRPVKAPTEEEKKCIKEWQEAVESGKIDEWLNKKH